MDRAAYSHVPQNFLGLPDELCNPATARSLILPIPYDMTASYGAGARNGPAAIIAASHQIEHYDMTLGIKPHLSGIATLPFMEPSAAGPEQMTRQIKEAADELIKLDRFLIGLGGDHSVTIGLAKAHASTWRDISFLHLDAHADLRDEYQGSKYSHACTAKRLSELGPVLQLGIRSACSEEIADRKTHKVATLSARELIEGRDWKEDAAEVLTESVYLTIDVDALDPSIMPSTGTPEPGGLDYFTVRDILCAIFKTRRVIGMDLVELAPIPGFTGPDVICAHLIQTAVGLRWPEPSRGGV